MHHYHDFIGEDWERLTDMIPIQQIDAVQTSVNSPSIKKNTIAVPFNNVHNKYLQNLAKM